MNHLQFGTFVFEHNPRKIEMQYARSLAAHLLPTRGAVMQDLGPRCRVVRCEGEVFAPTASAALAKLAAIGALGEQGAQMLFLPMGAQFCAFVSRFSYAAQGDGRIISYLIEFVEQDSQKKEEGA